MKEEDIQNHIIKEYGDSYKKEHLRAYIGFIEILFRKASKQTPEDIIDFTSYMYGALTGMKTLALAIGITPEDAKELAFCWDNITNGKTIEECYALSIKIAKDPILFPETNISDSFDNNKETRAYIESLWKKYQEYKETAEQSVFSQLVLYDAILEPSYKDLQEHWDDGHAKTFIKGMEDIIFNKLGIK